jgi:hypothetical protein
MTPFGPMTDFIVRELPHHWTGLDRLAMKRTGLKQGGAEDKSSRRCVRMLFLMIGSWSASA